jgi:hypothetical protein
MQVLWAADIDRFSIISFLDPSILQLLTHFTGGEYTGAEHELLETSLKCR